MHLLFINLGELLIPLWRGTIRCDPSDDKLTWDWVKLVGDVWVGHGKLVADATPYFPSSFHRPPRNPAEKISSGYKAIEYFLYLFGLGPAFFRTILPRKYWRNFCKLVRGVRIIIKRRIRGRQLQEAHSYLVQFVEEFENLYYQRRVDRLHFCRPCLHALLHAAPEVLRVGPGAYSTQFTMERTIGDLGQEIRQPSNPFANLAQRALQRSQINALKTMCLELAPCAPFLPRSSQDVGNGYVFLQPRDRYPRQTSGPEFDALHLSGCISKIRRWGRLRLSNGQISRSLWNEKNKSRQNIRITQNVMIQLNGQIEYAEVQFYFLKFADNSEELVPHALVSVYSQPIEELLEESYNELWACDYKGTDNLQVIETSSILSVVSMLLRL